MSNQTLRFLTYSSIRAELGNFKHCSLDTEWREQRVLRTEAAVTSRDKGEPALPAVLTALHLLNPS